MGNVGICFESFGACSLAYQSALGLGSVACKPCRICPMSVWRTIRCKYGVVKQKYKLHRQLRGLHIKPVSRQWPFASYRAMLIGRVASSLVDGPGFGLFGGSGFGF